MSSGCAPSSVNDKTELYSTKKDKYELIMIIIATIILKQLNENNNISLNRLHLVGNSNSMHCN